MKKLFTRFGIFALVILMMFNVCAGAFAASTSDEVTAREQESSDFSCYAATQGMVLLENSGVLPIAKEAKVALFGGGVRHTVKGGTGSGAVNQRSTVNVEEGFENAGYTVTTKDYLDAFDAKAGNGGGGGGMWGSRLTDDVEEIDAYIETAKAAGSEYAFYFVYRNSGEGSDRNSGKFDYLLSDIERANIEKINAAFDKTIIVLNTGGVMDTKFYKEIEGLDAMLLMSQPGMRGGDAVVAVLNGDVNPSGKLTDTWPLNYEDYPSAETFANNDRDTKHEMYTDDIYVGYRYFDTFGKEVSYPFGFGGSYTTFETKIDSVAVTGGAVVVKATVSNTGKVAGKEVVEVYFSAPDGELEKPYQELAGYAKTAEIEPGKSQSVAVSFPVSEMSSYSMDKAAYILEKGDYVIRVGNSSRNTAVGAVLTLGETVVTEQLSNQMEQDMADLEILSKKDATPITYAGEKDEIAKAERIAIDGVVKTVNNASAFDEEKITSYVYPGSEYKKAEGERYTKGPAGNSTVEAVKVFDAAEGKETIVELERPEGLEAGKYTLRDVATGKITMNEFVADLTVDEMAHICEGISGASNPEPVIGAASNSVRGAAGETTSLYYDTRLIPNTVLADGPAGVRITQHYTVREGEGEDQKTTDYYQFATAFPIGTMIAMTWDPAVIQEFGNRIGLEMSEFGVTLWLAPGMNIHRNALCGRNFEYYSEDPLVAGLTAAYTTLGVQSHPGVGVTLKHFSANSQESARNSENNTISERALREIYLKGFEIGVKMAQPMAIMTSYNQNNSMPAADDYDMCTDITRGEWGFKGLIMTDWGGGQSTPVNSMHAGNDLIMPGGSTASIINMFRDNPPTFDENTGYARLTGGQAPTENWGDFALKADGTDVQSVTVAATVDIDGNEYIQDKIAKGIATVTANEDGTRTIAYKGNFTDTAPTFDERTGYVTSTGGWRPRENWGDFALNAEGEVELSVTVAANVDVEGNQNIKAKVDAGTATITVNADGTKTVTYKGNYTDTAPTFDEKTGYARLSGGRAPTENWGEFVLSAEGKREESVTVAATVDVDGNKYIQKAVADGTVAIKVNDDGTRTLTYKGNYAANALPLGDLQKAASAVLNVIMQSAQFEKISQEYEGEVVKAESYSTKYASDLKTFQTGFADVAPSAWYAPYVTAVKNRGIMNGVNGYDFSPDSNIKRGDFVLMLYRLAGQPPVSEEELKFTDVEKDYYKDAIKWASDAGIVKGTSDTTFSPENPVKREQIATILYRMAGEPEVEDRLADFEDGASVSEYAKDAMSWAIANGVITGSKDTVTDKTLLKPAASASRSQISALIIRSLNLI